MSHLTAQDKKALELFKERLLELFADRVHELRVFGSKTRGEATKFSDVDVLVVLEGSTWRDSWPVHQAASAVSLETGVDLSMKILAPESVQRLRQHGSPLMASIDQEGIQI